RLFRIAFPSPLGSAAAPAPLLLFERFSSFLPGLLSLRHALQELLVIFRPALLAPVVLRYLILVRAHADADIVLPGVAGLAGDPRLARVLVLLGGPADAADDLVGLLLVLLLLLLQGLLGLLSLTALRGHGLFDL